MRDTIAAVGLCLALASGAQAAEEFKDYTGPFTTQVLYSLCSDNHPIARDKCRIYIQGLMYGIQTQRGMHEHGVPVCLPEMSAEAARRRILGFIGTTTGGNPASNKDGGDWVAFVALAAGNTCKK